MLSVASHGQTHLSMRRCVQAETVAPLASSESPTQTLFFRAHAGVHKASINKRLFKHGEAHRSLPLPPRFPISPVLPAVFSKHIPVGKQPPGGLGLSGGAYICLAGICLWIRNHLMHITADKQGRMESGSSVWHQHLFCPTASFSRNTSWITLCL